jgi:hypothetical protein
MPLYDVTRTVTLFQKWCGVEAPTRDAAEEQFRENCGALCYERVPTYKDERDEEFIVEASDDGQDPMVDFLLVAPGIEVRYEMHEFAKALARYRRLKRDGTDASLTLEVSPPDAIVRLHVFTDGTDDFYGPEELHQAIKLYREHKENNGNARLYIEVYEDEPAYEYDDMAIEDCLLGAGNFPS